MIRASLFRFIVACALTCFAAGTAVLSAADDGASRATLAGTYRIDGWKDLEGRGLYHFFYLDPGGRFYLAGEWKGSEQSRFGGVWSIAGDMLQLSGTADVDTNQGRWTVPYHRTFRIEHAQGTTRLTPVPEKNRFGLMGWPNSFVRARAGLSVNIPGGGIPADAKQVLRLSEALAPAKP